MTSKRIVSISQDMLSSIFEGAKRLYPRETVLLLRGKRKKDLVVISDLVIPPLASYGHGFANVPTYMLPIDFSVVGTVHSHPSGNLNPSPADLNHSFGFILMIVGFPFEDKKDVAAYNHDGEKLVLNVEPEAGKT